MISNLGGRRAVSQSDSVDDASQTECVNLNCYPTIVEHHEFLKQCISNDTSANFLRFCNPKNKDHSEQAVHSFQLKILRQETNRVEETNRAAIFEGQI